MIAGLPKWMVIQEEPQFEKMQGFIQIKISLNAK